MSKTISIQKSTIRKSCFTKSAIEIMDFFLQNVTIYFTPKTAALSMEKSHPTIKDTMRLLHQNSYLSKFSHDGTVYFITLSNMEFWHTDFKNHILSLQESKVRVIS